MYKVERLRQKIKSYLPNLGAHLIGIIVYILYESFIIWGIGTGAGTAIIMPYYLLAIALFYFSIWAIKRWEIPKFRWQAICLPLAGLLVYCVLFFHIQDKTDQILQHHVTTRTRLSMAIWRGAQFIIYAIFYYIARRGIANARKAGALQLRQKELENALLRAQINAHFLKNGLHLVYNMVDGKIPEAASLVKILSDYVSYTDFNAGEAEPLAPLTEELAQIDRYLEITSLQLGPSAAVEYSREIPEDCTAKIHPLLLLSFIENVFMHGIVTDPAHPARISIFSDGVILKLHTHNRKMTGKQRTSRHIGLRNSLTRLEGHYPGKYELTINEDEQQFTVDLNIKL